MPKRPTTTPEQEGIEFRPDGWERFKAAVHAAAKTPPPPKKAAPKGGKLNAKTRRRSSRV